MEIAVKNMAKILIELRGKKSQAEVAKALGISKSALAMYELGERVPRDPVKCRIAEYYDKSITYIFYNTKVHDTCSE